MKKYSAKYLSYVKKFIGYTILFLMVFIPPFMVFRETGFIGVLVMYSTCVLIMLIFRFVIWLISSE